MSGENIRELADAIYVDRVKRARREAPGEKFLDGARLFDVACQRMLAGLRHENPEATDEELHTLLQKRVDRLRQVEEYGIFHPVESPK